MKIQDLVKRIDELIIMGNDVLETGQSDEEGFIYVNRGAIKSFRSSGLSFIERVYQNQHPHYIEFELNTNGFYSDDVDTGISILQAIKSEIEGGWLFSIKGLVTSEVFADFLEMAEYLLKENYKDPSAVMAGSVLEEHIRQLCIKNNVNIEEEKHDKVIPIKADRLNSELTKKDVYSKLDQKMVTAWLDLRNKAAHGKYEEYTKEQVSTMMQGIRNFQ